MLLKLLIIELKRKTTNTDLPALSSISHRTLHGFCLHALSVVFHRSSQPVWGRIKVVLSCWEMWQLRMYLLEERYWHQMLKMEHFLHVEHGTTARLYPARLIWKVSCFSVGAQPVQKLGFLILHQWQQMVYFVEHAEAKTQGDLNGIKIDICCADKGTAHPLS